MLHDLMFDIDDVTNLHQYKDDDPYELLDFQLSSVC